MLSRQKNREDFVALRDIIMKLTPNHENDLYPIDACKAFCFFGLCVPLDVQVEQLCQMIQQRIDERNQNARNSWFASLTR